MTTHRLATAAAALLLATAFVPVSFARSLPTVGQQAQYFLPFTNNYLKLPIEWTTAMKQRDMTDKAVFTGASSATFTVGKFAAADCDQTKLAARTQTSWGDQKPPSSAIATYSRIPGVLGAALTWQEMVDGKAMKMWCVVPVGKSHSSSVTVRADDGTTALFVQKTVLSQLFQVNKRGR